MVKLFLAKINITDSGCWEWTGSLSPKGYGRLSYQGKQYSTHRFIYEYYYGEIDPNLTIDHLCRNRACVNPLHLEQVSMTENVLRGNGPTAVNARKTHCIRGHEFTPENIIKNGNGRRCRNCHKIIAHNSYMRNYDDIQAKGKIYYQGHKEIMKANAKRNKLKRKMLQKVII